MKPGASLLDKVSAKIVTVKVDNKEALMHTVSPENIAHRVGVGVRHAGDDGSAAFRIPGLATTNKGTLLGVYDVRYNSSVDLQEHVDVGLSRSVDGGKTWEKMRLPLAFGETGGLACCAERCWRPFDLSGYQDQHNMGGGGLDTWNG